MHSYIEWYVSPVKAIPVNTCGILKFVVCFRDTETRRTKFSEWLMESYQFYGLFVKKVSAVCTVYTTTTV